MNYIYRRKSWSTLLFACVFVMLFIGFFVTSAQDPPEGLNVVPEQGFVPNEETAINIAVAVWIPIWGEERIERQKPYNAELGEDGIWRVKGSPPPDKPGTIRVGGVAYAHIAKKDGCIKRVFHTY